MSAISDLLDMIDRKAPMYLRAQSGVGPKTAPVPEIRLHDVTRKPWTKIDPAEVNEWVTLYVEKKMSSYAIGEKFGRDCSAVRYHLIARGVKLRTRKQAASVR